MDGFIFRYERILKLRQEEEEQCKNALALRLKEEMEHQKRLDALHGRLERYNAETAAEIAAGCTVQRLREAEAERKWLLEAIENQDFLLSLKKGEVREARISLGEASKKKKIMEKLKENEYMEFQKEAELAEELMTDQIVTFGSSQKDKS